MVSLRIGNLGIEATKGAMLLAGVLAALSAIRLGSRNALAGAALLVVSLLVHEIGHLAMAQALGVRVKAIGLCLKGAYLRRRQSSSPIAELVIAASGPAANLLLFFWFRDGDAVLRWVALLNLVVALSNLVPIPGSDGSRICQALRGLWTAA